VGVLANDQPPVPEWDLAYMNGDQDALYLPFRWGPALQAWPEAIIFQSRMPDRYPDLLASDAQFVSHWVELTTADSRAAYRAHVARQFGDQGQLRSLAEWRRDFPLPGSNTVVFTVLLAIALGGAGFNNSRLMLARAAASRDTVGIHRALGATRASVFAQQMVEASLITVPAAVAGVVATLPLLWASSRIATENDIPVLMTPLGAALGFVVSVAVGLGAASYPAWRLSRTAATVYLERL
jgi:putative ABC transport system permease protein